MSANTQLIRFDWAMKKLLRNKSNFVVLEGFLSELLKDDIKIHRIGESESNKDELDDKFNRVDIFVENSKGELIIIEIQNTQEFDYFHRMLYGTSKAITEHINSGDAYAQVKKIISITIAYFDLGQGEDYVYHGTTTFVGQHNHDTFALSPEQVVLYQKISVHQIFPEYWVIKVGNFKNIIQDRLDEWIYLFKNSAVKEDFNAKGIKAAEKTLDTLKLSKKERLAYEVYLKHLRDKASENHTLAYQAKHLIEAAKDEGMEIGVEKGMEIGVEKGIEIGVEKGRKEEAELQHVAFVLRLHKQGKSVAEIAFLTGLSEDYIQQIITQHSP